MIRRCSLHLEPNLQSIPHIVPGQKSLPVKDALVGGREVWPLSRAVAVMIRSAESHGRPSSSGARIPISPVSGISPMPNPRVF